MRWAARVSFFCGVLWILNIVPNCPFSCLPVGKLTQASRGSSILFRVEEDLARTFASSNWKRSLLFASPEGGGHHDPKKDKLGTPRDKIINLVRQEMRRAVFVSLIPYKGFCFIMDLCWWRYLLNMRNRGDSSAYIGRERELVERWTRTGTCSLRERAVLKFWMTKKRRGGLNRP